MIWGVTARQCVVQCVLHVVRAADTVLVCNCTEHCVRLQHCPPLQETWVLCVQTYRSSFRLNSTTGNTATVWATCCFNTSTSELIKKTTHFFVGQKKFEAADVNTSKQTTWIKWSLKSADAVWYQNVSVLQLWTSALVKSCSTSCPVSEWTHKATFYATRVC